MSRGAGVWQRGILAAVDSFGMVYVRDLLPDDARKSELNAIERAAWALQAQSRIALISYACGRPKLLATRVGWPVGHRPARATRRPVSVGEVPQGHYTHIQRREGLT